VNELIGWSMFGPVGIRTPLSIALHRLVF